MGNRIVFMSFGVALAWATAISAAPTDVGASTSSARALGMSSSTDAPVESPLLTAQRFYAQSQWVQASEAYESACAVLPKVEKVPCRHWGVLALAQTGNIDDFWKASNRLDTLLSLTEPENVYFADLLLTRSRLHLLQGNAELAARTWKMCAVAANPDLAVPLYQLCDDIAQIDSSLSKECVRVKPKDGALLSSVPRVRTVPMGALRSSSSVVGVSSSSTVVEQAQVALSAGWVLQLGAFGIKENGKMQLDNLKKQKIKARMIEKAGPNRILYVVITDTFATKEGAQEYATKNIEPLKLDYHVVPSP